MFENDVFTDGFIERVLRVTCDRRSDDGRVRLKAERAELAAKIENLKTAIEVGADIPALVAMLRERTERLHAVTPQLEDVAVAPDRERLKAALERRVADWKAQLLTEHPAEARFIVEQLLGPTPLTL